jgi:hypothetical protein
MVAEVQQLQKKGMIIERGDTESTYTLHYYGVKRCYGMLCSSVCTYTVAYIPVSRSISAYANQCISLLIEHVLLGVQC